MSSSLRKALTGSDYEELVELIDWSATPRRSLLRVYVCAALAALALIAGGTAAIALALWLVSTRPVSPIALWLVSFASIAVIASNFCTLFVKWARRELSKFPETSLFASNAPTLYLREFNSENPNFAEENIATLRPSSALALLRDMTIGPLLTLPFLLGRSDRSFENLLSKETKRIGPLICLSDPNRRRKTGEARRLQVQSPRWQEAVDLLLQRCNLVVLCFARGGSVAWEGQRVVSGTRKPTLIWMPGLPTPPNWRPGENYIGSLPDWLRMPLERDGIAAATLDDPQADYLFLFDADRRVFVRQAKSGWTAMRRAIRELLKESRIESEKQTPARPQSTVGPAVAAGALWLAPRAALVAIALYAYTGFSGRANDERNFGDCDPEEFSQPYTALICAAAADAPNVSPGRRAYFRLSAAAASFATGDDENARRHLETAYSETGEGLFEEMLDLAGYSFSDTNIFGGRSDVALGFASFIISREPSHPAALALRARARLATGDTLGAIADADAAYTANPSSEAAFLKCRTRLGIAEQWEAARPMCEEAAEGAGMIQGDEELHIAVGRLALLQQRHTDALVAFELALQLQANSTRAEYGRGLARLALGDAGGAEDLAIARQSHTEIVEEYDRLNLRPSPTTP